MCLVVRPHFASIALMSLWSRDAKSFQTSSIQVFSFAFLVSCSKYPISRNCPLEIEPEIGFNSPTSDLISVVFPSPFAPVIAIF